MPSPGTNLGTLLGVDGTDDNAIRLALQSEVISPFKVVKIPVTALSTGEKDTGVDLPTKGIVLDCFVDVKTAEATASTKTIDVGLLSSESGGDADGFLDGAVDSSIAVVRGSITVTDGTNQNFIAAAPTLGALLRTGELGGDAAGTAAALIKTPHVLNGTAKSVTYTLGATHTELVADIIVIYCDLANI
jgi:hypothetical protein